MTRTSPRISVVMPVFNRAEVIGEALQSLYVQTRAPEEVIIVDDGSSDDVAGAVEAVGSPPNARVRVIHHETNRGANAARNTGIEASEGAWIAFFDSDDLWHPNRLERHADVIASAPSDVGVIYSAYEMLRPDGAIDAMSPYQSCTEGPMLDQLGRRNVVGTFSAATVRRDVLDLVGGLDESLPSCQDWDLWIRCAQVTAFRCIDEKLLTYRHGRRGQSITGVPSRVREGHEQFFSKHRAAIERAGGEGHLYHRLGDICMRLPDSEASRRYFARAVAEEPLRLRWWLKLLAASLGPGVFRKTRDLLRRIRAAGTASQ